MGKVGKGEGGGQTEMGTKITNEGPRASSTSSSWVCYAFQRVEDLQVIKGGAISYAPPTTPEPITTSRTVRGGNLHNLVL